MKIVATVSLLLAFCFAPLVLHAASTGDRRPVALVTVAPSYPVEMKKTGIAGSATVEFIVEIDGTVSSAQVVQATHPEFGKAVASCILNWKFEPGVKGGRLVRCRMQQSMLFDIDPSPEERANAAIEIKETESVKQGDVAPKIAKWVKPVYPKDLIVHHTSGSVTAEFWVTSAGLVDGFEIIKGTDKVLETSVKVSISRWKFEPPLRNGRPVRMKLRQVVNFTYAQPVERPEVDAAKPPPASPTLSPSP